MKSDSASLQQREVKRENKKNETPGLKTLTTFSRPFTAKMYDICQGRRNLWFK
jgi:hypothetical protein